MCKIQYKLHDNQSVKDAKERVKETFNEPVTRNCELFKAINIISVAT